MLATGEPHARTLNRPRKPGRLNLHDSSRYQDGPGRYEARKFSYVGAIGSRILRFCGRETDHVFGAPDGMLTVKNIQAAFVGERFERLGEADDSLRGP